MTRSNRLANLHRRYDGPIAGVVRRRADYPGQEAFDAARMRGIVAHFTRQIVTTARAMTAALAAGRVDRRALSQPELVGLATDLSTYVQARRTWLARATRR